MAVNIEIFGQLLPGQPRKRTIEIQEPAVVRDLAQKLGLELSAIGLITVDGVQSELEDAVPNGSRLCFFPYVSGG